jgi:pilus assembly protein CpaE
LQRIEALLARHKGTGSADEPATPLQTTVFGQGPHFISVVGARGGAGATTVALNVAATMAEAGINTILADLDTQQGHAALYLGHQTDSDVLDWLNQPAGDLDETLPDYLVEIGDQLSLLPARFRVRQDKVRLRAPQVAALATILSDTGRVVIADLGSQLDEALRPALQHSDVILVCLRPERAAIVGAREIVEYLASIVDEKKIQLVMLDYGLGESMPRPAVESYLGKPLCDVLELDLATLTKAVNRHRPLVYDADQQQMLVQFRQLLAQVVPAS